MCNREIEGIFLNFMIYDMVRGYDDGGPVEVMKITYQGLFLHMIIGLLAIARHYVIHCTTL